MRYEIRQLDLGGILDQAIRLTTGHFGLLFGILACIWIPVQLFGSLAITFYAGPVVLQPGVNEMEVLQAQMRDMPLIFGVLALVMLTTPITNAALIHAIASQYLGRPVTIGQAYGRAFSAILPLYGTWLLVVLAIFGGTLLCVIPGIIAAFWFSLATQIVIVERISGMDALNRSKALMKGNIGTLFVMGLLLGIITLGVTWAVQFITQQQVQTVVTVIIQGILVMFQSAAYVVFYFSARCQHEQFDLQLLAEGIGEDMTMDGADADPWRQS